MYEHGIFPYFIIGIGEGGINILNQIIIREMEEVKCIAIAQDSNSNDFYSTDLKNHIENSEAVIIHFSCHQPLSLLDIPEEIYGFFNKNTEIILGASQDYSLNDKFVTFIIPINEDIDLCNTQ